MRFRAVWTIMAAAMCSMTSACVGGRSIHYYTINPSVVSAPASRSEGPVLVIGRITTPEPLQDGRIRYRIGSNEVGAYEYHRWDERPAAIVQDLLIQALRASGKFRNVLEASTSALGDYLIRGRLLEFAEVDDADIHSRISLRLEMVDRKTGAVVWEHNYNRDEPVEGRTVKEVVLSIEHNLQQVIGEATLAIETSTSHQ